MDASAETDRKFEATAYYVYRASDGTILLSHTFVRPEGAPHNEAAIERDLLAEASRRARIAQEELAILTRDAAHPVDGTILRVDPRARQLVISHERFPRARG